MLKSFNGLLIDKVQCVSSGNILPELFFQATVCAWIFFGTMVLCKNFFLIYAYALARYIVFHNHTNIKAQYYRKVGRLLPFKIHFTVSCNLPSRVLTFRNERWRVLFCGADYYAVQNGSKSVCVCGRNQKVWPFKWKLLSSTFLCRLLFIMLYKAVLTFESVNEILQMSSTFLWYCLLSRTMSCKPGFFNFWVLCLRNPYRSDFSSVEKDKNRS